MFWYHTCLEQIRVYTLVFFFLKFAFTQVDFGNKLNSFKTMKESFYSPFYQIRKEKHWKT